MFSIWNKKSSNLISTSSLSEPEPSSCWFICGVLLYTNFHSLNTNCMNSDDGSIVPLILMFINGYKEFYNSSFLLLDFIFICYENALSGGAIECDPVSAYFAIYLIIETFSNVFSSLHHLWLTIFSDYYYFISLECFYSLT